MKNLSHLARIKILELDLQNKNWVEESDRGWIYCLLENCAFDKSANRLLTQDEMNTHFQKVHSSQDKTFQINLKLNRVRIIWNEETGKLDSEIGKEIFI